MRRIISETYRRSEEAAKKHMALRRERERGIRGTNGIYQTPERLYGTVDTLEILGKTTGIRANFEMPTGALGRGVTTTPTTSTVRTVIERSCTTQSAHGSGAVQKTTAYEPKYSDDTT